MSKSDLALVTLNLFSIVLAVIGLTAQHLDPMSVALAVALAAAVVNGGALLRRSRRPENTPVREAEDLDARTVLDLDARLDALERAYADAADADKWRALVESGQVSGPAADPLADAADDTRQRRNGVA